MNQVFLLYIGEDLSRDTSMDSMREVNSTAKFLTEGVEDAAYVSNIPTAGTEVIAELTGGDSGSTAKRMKKILPPDMETISDPVISRYTTKLQLHLNNSSEVIVRDQASAPSYLILWVSGAM